MEYVSLHHHSTFSYGDGFGLPREHVEFAASVGMTALALTEHGNTSSHVQLEKACKQFGIKPIYGVEGYIAKSEEQRKCHQTILAMNQTGLANLNRLVTQSWRDFYKWPTIYLKYLEQYNDGLIVLSGCADSQLSSTLLGGKYYGEKRLTYEEGHFKSACRLVRWFKNVLGDRYYIETQAFPDLKRTCILNQAFEKISNECGVPLVATCDCHYLSPADNEIQKILHASHRGSSVSQVEASWEYDITLHIPTSDDEVWNRLSGTGLSDDACTEALLNTGRIAARTGVYLPKVEPLTYPIQAEDWEPWVT